MTGNPASVGPAPDGLLPCPFCGGNARTAQRNPAKALWFVQCDNCDASQHGQLGIENAIAAWNTRAPHPDREAEPTGGVVDAIATALSGAFITTVSFGDPDPARRSAEVRIVFSGERPAEKAHTAHDAILSALSVSPPVVEGALRASPFVPTALDHPAVANLRENQQQLDPDGVMVGVSRQALDEVLALFTAPTVGQDVVRDAEQ